MMGMSEDELVARGDVADAGEPAAPRHGAARLRLGDRRRRRRRALVARLPRRLPADARVPAAVVVDARRGRLRRRVGRLVGRLN